MRVKRGRMNLNACLIVVLVLFFILFINRNQC